MSSAFIHAEPAGLFEIRNRIDNSEAPPRLLDIAEIAALSPGDEPWSKPVETGGNSAVRLPA